MMAKGKLKNRRENILKAIRFERPEYIPMKFAINSACWQNYPQDILFDLMESHKFLFPDFKRPKHKYIPEFMDAAQKDNPFTDDWGCIWKTTEDGIVGTVISHPLSDWSEFQNYNMPDPNQCSDQCSGIGRNNWKTIEENIIKAKKRGGFITGGLVHGHTFLRLCDIRGYENLIYDMADEEPNLYKLIDMIENFNSYIVNRYLEIGVDMMIFPEDLGMQTGPMISPENFRKYIKPSYQRLMQRVRKEEVIVHMHSDGDIRELLDDIIDGGVEVVNLQDRVNGIDWIADKLTGRICIDLDIDRQFITAQGGTPKQIDALIREEVEKLSRKEGGLMMIYDLYPGVPVDNIKAVMDAMEKYAFYY